MSENITIVRNQKETLVIQDGCDLHIELQENAELTVFCLSKNATKNRNIVVNQDRTSRFYYHDVTLGGSAVKNTMVINLDQPGAECVLNGLFVTSDKQAFGHDVVIKHNAEHTNSTQTFKGIASGGSHGSYFGRVIVKKDAQKINADQSSNNLLLSKTAQISAKPELEIYADDVKCSHGVTMGDLDENAIFYLQSRGIPYEDARAMLIFAFAKECIDRVPESEMGQKMLSELLAAMPAEKKYEASL